MKIGTWNVERLKHKKKLSEIISLIELQHCDIMVLTEYDERITPSGYQYELATENLSLLDAKYYKSTEKRVKIYSKYEIINRLDTYDNFTTCCAEIKTNKGILLVYGTIMGIIGNRDKNFKNDLSKQIADINKYANRSICVIGDYNISFSDNYYFTHWGRNELNHCFAENNMKILTQGKAETIDHITISSSFIDKSDFEIAEWNIDKELSDHKGISVELN